MIKWIISAIMWLLAMVGLTSAEEEELTVHVEDLFWTVTDSVETGITEMVGFLTTMLPVLVWLAFIFITINWWGAILSAVRNLFGKGR